MAEIRQKKDADEPIVHLLRRGRRGLPGLRHPWRPSQTRRGTKLAFSDRPPVGPQRTLLRWTIVCDRAVATPDPDQLVYRAGSLAERRQLCESADSTRIIVSALRSAPAIGVRRGGVRAWSAHDRHRPRSSTGFYCTLPGVCPVIWRATSRAEFALYRSHPLGVLRPHASYDGRADPFSS